MRIIVVVVVLVAAALAAAAAAAVAAAVIVALAVILHGGMRIFWLCFHKRVIALLGKKSPRLTYVRWEYFQLISLLKRAEATNTGVF